MALRPRTPVGLNCSLGSPIQSSGPLGALLSSPALERAAADWGHSNQVLQRPRLAQKINRRKKNKKNEPRKRAPQRAKIPKKY